MMPRGVGAVDFRVKALCRPVVIRLAPFPIPATASSCYPVHSAAAQQSSVGLLIRSSLVRGQALADLDFAAQGGGVAPRL